MSRSSLPPGVPIVTFGPGDPSLLVPGAAVFFSATSADGRLSATRILVGKDGVVPRCDAGRTLAPRTGRHPLPGRASAESIRAQDLSRSRAAATRSSAKT